MIFRRRSWQTLPMVATLFAAAGFLALGTPHAFAQTSGSSGSSLLGSSSGVGTGTSSSSGSSLLGSSSSSGSLLGGAGSGSGTSLTGSSLTGSTAASTFRASTNGVGPSASNIVAPYYLNPLTTGMPNSSTTTGNTTSNKPFGSPLYDTLNTSNSTANVSRSSNSSSGVASVPPTNTIRVGPRYTQSLGWKMPAVPSTRMQTELQAIISGSQRLTASKNIQVTVDGQTVVLRGIAADDHEKALAGAILSMSPGVYDIRNELKVQAPAQPSGQPVPGAILGQPGQAIPQTLLRPPNGQRP